MQNWASILGPVKLIASSNCSWKGKKIKINKIVMFEV